MVAEHILVLLLPEERGGREGEREGRGSDGEREGEEGTPSLRFQTLQTSLFFMASGCCGYV